jgi:hypothetical protein
MSKDLDTRLTDEMPAGQSILWGSFQAAQTDSVIVKINPSLHKQPEILQVNGGAGPWRFRG